MVIDDSKRHGALIEARFENAQDTVDNKRLWENAQLWNINYAAHQGVRWKLMGRAQYTYRNNSYAQGICNTLADDTIGAGPKLQITAPNQEAANRLENDWAEWSEEIGLAEKLWQARLRKVVDGESFLVEETNDRLMHPVKLDVRCYDAAHFYSINQYPSERDGRVYTDGIILDKRDNPLFYEKQPYDLFSSQQYLNNYQPSEMIAGDFVYHLYQRTQS